MFIVILLFLKDFYGWYSMVKKTIYLKINMKSYIKYALLLQFMFFISCDVNVVKEKYDGKYSKYVVVELDKNEMYVIDFIDDFYNNNRNYEYMQAKYPILFADTLSKYNRPDAKDIPQDINYYYFLKKKNKIKDTHFYEIKLCSYFNSKLYNENIILQHRQFIALYKINKKERLFFEFNSKSRDTTLILTDIRLDTFSTCNLKKYYKEKLAD
jgi:hypothetical protein